jgi:hypothetical protein
LESYNLSVGSVACSIIERTARESIRQRNSGLDKLMPNKKDVRNPKTEYLLCEFEYIVKSEIRLPDGTNHGFVSELNALQQDILAILQVPPQCFSYQYPFDTQCLKSLPPKLS